MDCYFQQCKYTIYVYNIIYILCIWYHTRRRNITTVQTTVSQLAVLSAFVLSRRLGRLFLWFSCTHSHRRRSHSHNSTRTHSHARTPANTQHTRAPDGHTHTYTPGDGHTIHTRSRKNHARTHAQAQRTNTTTATLTSSDEQLGFWTARTGWGIRKNKIRKNVQRTSRRRETVPNCQTARQRLLPSLIFCAAYFCIVLGCYESEPPAPRNPYNRHLRLVLYFWRVQVYGRDVNGNAQRNRDTVRWRRRRVDCQRV